MLHSISLFFYSYFTQPWLKRAPPKKQIDWEITGSPQFKTICLTTVWNYNGLSKGPVKYFWLLENVAPPLHGHIIVTCMLGNLFAPITGWQAPTIIWLLFAILYWQGRLQAAAACKGDSLSFLGLVEITTCWQMSAPCSVEFLHQTDLVLSF